MESKDEIRKRIAGNLSLVAKEKLALESVSVCRELKSLPEYKDARLVLSYMPMPGETDVLPFNREVLSSGRILCLPRVVKGTSEMDFYFMERGKNLESQLSSGAWGIMEPRADCVRLERIPESPVFVVVPGVAFTSDGKRLGHGKGYYDIYLPRLKEMCRASDANLFLAGVCFTEQCLENLPTVHTDIKMDTVITPC